jgi:hypothetical protein
MGFLGKNVGSHVAGMSKYLGKNLYRGSSYLGKVDRYIGSIKDRYANLKNNVVSHITNYNKGLGSAANTAIDYAGGKLAEYTNPFTSQLKPLMKLGQGIGNSLQNV